MADRKKLLIISGQPIIPPITGGAIRTYHLLTRLAASFEIIAVASPPFAPQAAASVPFLRTLRAICNVQWLSTPPEINGMGKPLGQNFVPLESWHEDLARLMEIHQPSAVMLEHVWNAETLRYLRERFPASKYILDAHNIESSNLERYAKLHPNQRAAIEKSRKLALEIETNLDRYVDQVWACSEHDIDKLRELNGEGLPDTVLVRNGVDCKYFSFIEEPQDKPENLLFVGTLSYPLVQDALAWFLRDIWRAMRYERRELTLSIVGRSPQESLRKQIKGDRMISIHPDVPDIRPFMKRATLSICPMLSGSGTRIKILEAMAAGLPVVSTSIGAEGIPAEQDKQIVMADCEKDFISALLRLLSERETREGIRRDARAWVEAEFDWDRIAGVAGAALERLLA